VKRPAVYELRKAPATLEEVVTDAGGFTAAASASHISVERVNEYKGRETLTVAVPQDGEDGEVLRAIRDFAVRDGDRIVIAPVLPYSERLVYLEGHVARPGRQPYRDGMRLSDVIHSYADLLPEPAQHAELIRLIGPDLHAETMEFNLRDALIGNVNPTLQPFDTIRVRGRYDEDAPQVTVRGEVLRPGVYPLSEGMTAGQLVRMAGGFKRDALLERADIASYMVTDGHDVQGKLRSVSIGAAVEGREADVRLQPGDILSVHQITGWDEIGAAVTVEGQVKFPGSYGFVEGEHLSSVLRRTGGFRESAYPEGAVLTREQVRDLETKSRDELVREIETNSAAARLSPSLGGGDTAPTLQLIKAQQDEVIAQLKSHPPTGRLVVHLTADIDSWANTPADIELRSGDVLTVPKRPGFVLVTGQVYNSTAVTFAPDKSAGWYLARAGGANTTANRKEIFVIRANGSVVGRRSTGRFEGDVLSLKLDPGDVIVVPQKIMGNSLAWRNLLTTAQLASSLAITAAVAGL
jgi:protein involved in polysaccharide export with SLBB domain